MESKIISSFLLTAIVALFALTLVSAAGPFTQLTSSVNYTATITTPTTVAFSAVTNDAGTSIAPTYAINGQVITFTDSPDYTLLTTGKTYSTTATIGNGSSTETTTLQILKTFCSLGKQNATGLSFDVSISNDGEGEEDTWLPLDPISIDVDFDNSGSADLNNVQIELGLIEKATGKNVAKNLIWTSKGKEIGDVNDVDSDESADTHTFEFEVANKIDSGDYILMIKVYPDNEEDTTCLDSSTDLASTFYQSIDVDRESADERQIILKDIVLEPSTAACGSEIKLTAKAYNIGETDQDAVKVILYNKALGVDLNQVFENFNMDKSKTVELTFKAPTDVKEGLYTFALYSKYDYDKDDDKDDDTVDFSDDAFSQDSDTDSPKLTLEGSCLGSVITGAAISAVLSEDTPDAVIGKQTIVQTTIKNTGNAAATYTLSVSGVSSWAQVAKIEPTTLTLAAGASGTVNIYLDVDSAATAGDKEFTIKASATGATDVEQKVALSLKEGSSASALINHIKSNAFIYTVILVDLVLIIAIVIAVKRMVGKKS